MTRHTRTVQSGTAAIDLYATLGVAPTASTEEIAAAFRVHAKELHPDRHPGDAAVAERFKSLTNAYNVLARPASRSDYDHRRAGREASATPAAPRPGHAPVFRTPGRARAAIWGGGALFVVGIAAGVVLAGLDTGDTAETITLWIVVVKLVVCGVLLGAFGAWRLSRLRVVTAR
jgi:hypothetical protein